MCSINEKFPERVGRLTSSKIGVVLNSFKEATYYAASNKEKAGQIKHPGGWSDGAKTYARSLAIDRHGFIKEDILTFAMMWGNQWEPVNREAYAKRNSVEVSEETHITKGDFEGSTVDGFVGDDGLFESKCLQIDAHLRAIEAPDEDHVLQCQHQLYVTGCGWCDLVYFHPETPTRKTMQKTWRIYPDLELHEQMKEMSAKFNDELVRVYEELYKD